MVKAEPSERAKWIIDVDIWVRTNIFKDEVQLHAVNYGECMRQTCLNNRYNQGFFYVT